MIKKIFISLIVAGTLSGCSFLDVTPDKTGNATIYHMDQLDGLMGDYSLYNRSMYLWSDNLFYSDDVEVSPYFYSKVKQNSTYLVATWDRDFVENGGTVDACSWDGSFGKLFNFNTVLEYLDKVEQTTPEMKEQVRGEALFGRAYYHFFALVNYCKYDMSAPGIGYKDNTNPPPTGVPARQTVEYTVGRIRDDIAAAKEALTKANRTKFEIKRNFRITLPTVYAFEARLELYLGNYDAAFTAADNALKAYNVLVDFKNDPMYERTKVLTVNVLDAEGNPTGETIDYHEMTQLMNEGAEAFTKYEEMYLPHRTDLYFANKGISMSESLYNLFDRDNDARWLYFYNNNYLVCKEAAFSSNGFDVEEQANLKEWERHTYLRFANSYSSGKFFILGPTTAEMYLIRAECYARKGETAMAKNDLVTLRKTRFMNDASASDIDGTLQDVLDERRREFAGILRFYDLKRLNFGDNANITVTKKRHSDVQDFNSPVIDVTLKPDDSFYAVPIPATELMLMGWEQNE